MNQSQFQAITCNSLKAREKLRVHGAIGLRFASHWWLKNWRESFKPITKRSNRNHEITFDRHLKTALFAMFSESREGKKQWEFRLSRKISNITCWAAIKLNSHRHPTVPRSRVEANVTGHERFADAMENDSKAIDISLKQLETELIKRFPFNVSITRYVILQIKEITIFLNVYIYIYIYISIFIYFCFKIGLQLKK